MDMKRVIVRALLLCYIAATFVACKLPDDSVGSPREIGWRLFDFADEHIERSMDMVWTAYCFNEYHKQTTVEGRAAVKVRYFPNCGISGSGNVWWIVDHLDEVCRIEMRDGLLLEAADAQWILSHPETMTGEVIKELVISREPDGRCRCELTPLSDVWSVEKAMWWTSVVFGDLFQELTIEGSGLMEGKAETSMYPTHIDYTIVDKLFFVRLIGFEKGSIDIKLSISEFEEFIHTEATYLGGGKVRIIINGITDWRDHYSD